MAIVQGAPLWTIDLEVAYANYQNGFRYAQK